MVRAGFLKEWEGAGCHQNPQASAQSTRQPGHQKVLSPQSWPVMPVPGPAWVLPHYPEAS